MKILLHVSNLEQIDRMQKNIINLLKENNELIISVVANGEAVLAFKNTEDVTINEEVSYYMCNNSMRSYKLNENEMKLKVSFTSSGVYKLAKLQEEGFLYIKV